MRKFTESDITDQKKVLLSEFEVLSNSFSLIRMAISNNKNQTKEELLNCIYSWVELSIDCGNIVSLIMFQKTIMDTYLVTSDTIKPVLIKQHIDLLNTLSNDVKSISFIVYESLKNLRVVYYGRYGNNLDKDNVEKENEEY
jgi:hypothetical protein